MKNQPVIFLFLLLPFLLHGSVCLERYKTITEILNDSTVEHDIFQCEVLKTYKKNESLFQSIAVVKKWYRGADVDTVYINNGNKKMIPHSEWIIISRPMGKGYYSVGSCYNLSELLKPSSTNDCHQNNTLGKLYLNVIEQFEQVKSTDFTGKKLIFYEKKIVAEGEFKNGKPEGKWIHYSKLAFFEKKILRSKVSYINGVPEGIYQTYSTESKGTELESERAFKNGRIIWKEELGRIRVEYQYVKNGIKVTTKEMDAETGKIIKHIETFQKDSENDSYNSISFREGIYINKSPKDSSEYFPLGEGTYQRGARTGYWKFFNKKGEIVRERYYEEKKIDTTTFEIFGHQETLILSGKYEGNKRVGIWKSYYDTKLTGETFYNHVGDIILEVRYFPYGNKTVTPFLDGEKHGIRISYNREGKVNRIENFQEGEQHGITIFYNDDGEIMDELYYVHSRKNTIFSSSGRYQFKDGFRHGYYISPTTKRRITKTEGNFWYGYRTGIWITYYSNGNYIKKYYETDPNKLMSNCSKFYDYLKLEQFDKNGKLINSESPYYEKKNDE